MDREHRNRTAVRRQARRPDVKSWAVAVAVMLAMAALGEGAAATWSAYRRGQLERRPDGPLLIVRDAALGWRAAPNRDIALPGGGRFTTGAHGWRRYDVAAPKPLLVVLGDSYTHAAGVADGAVYYDAIARRLSLAVAALAVNGYGTAQELLVAREAAPALPRPAAVLLQMTDNDPINNSLALERRSYINNNLLPRPYLLDSGAVAIADPRRLHERLVLGRELTRYVFAGRLGTVESAVEAGGPEALALYRGELRHTAEALRLLRRAYANTPAVAFNVGGSSSRIGRDLERLAREAGFAYVDLGPPFGDPAQRSGIVQADGAHWNAAGHALAGQILAETLRPLIASK